MSTSDTPLIIPDRIESTLRRIETECNLFITRAMHLWAKNPTAPAPNLVLVRSRFNSVRELLNTAKAAETDLRQRRMASFLKGLMLYAAPGLLPLTAMIAVPGEREMLISSIGVGAIAILFWDRVAAPMLAGNPVTAVDHLRRRRQCLEQLHRIRCMLHVIDSHVLAKSLRGHWDTSERPSEVALPGQNTPDTDWVYQDSSLAIRYLSIASSLARCCAKIAALYPQWFTDSEVSREADSLAALAFEIERGCLAKTELIRQGALRLGQPGMTDISVAVRLADAA